MIDTQEGKDVGYFKKQESKGDSTPFSLKQSKE